MEIDLAIKYDDMREDSSRKADGLRRDIFNRFPDAVWERYGDGHRIII